MIPKNHPRYDSLILREKIKDAYKKEYLADSGMIAHGRGETFDYLLGEKTTPSGENATKVAVAQILLAENPVISVNGNSTALAIDEIIELAKELNCKIELNLFYRTEKRVEIIKNLYKEHGWENLLGCNTEKLKNLDKIKNPRSTADEKGIYTSDVILVALEDGDRAEILKTYNKTVIAIDLNPLSRTGKMSDITIVDNIIRAIPNMTKIAKEYKNKNQKELKEIINKYNNKENIKKSLKEFKIKEMEMDN